MKDLVDITFIMDLEPGSALGQADDSPSIECFEAVPSASATVLWIRRSFQPVRQIGRGSQIHAVLKSLSHWHLPSRKYGRPSILAIHHPPRSCSIQLPHVPLSNNKE
jgi:hypothetical protein